MIHRFYRSIERSAPRELTDNLDTRHAASRVERLSTRSIFRRETHGENHVRQGGGRPVRPSAGLTDDIALDFSAGEGLVGIEILRASRLFDTPESPKIDLKNLIPRIVQA